MTRQQLLNAAIQSIANDGLKQASLNRIAQAAGVTSGAVQYHFRSRDDLLLAVVESFGTALGVLSSAASAAPGADSLYTRVDHIIRRYWQHFKSPHYTAVMSIWLNTPTQTPLYRAILERLNLFEMQFDREWLTDFADCPAPADRIVGLRHIALGTLRGLALSQSYVIDHHRLNREIDLLVSMIAQSLSRAH